MQLGELEKSISLGPDVNFNLSDGSVVAANSDSTIEKLGTVPLADLLTGYESHLRKQCELPETGQWGRRDFVRWGRWIYDVIEGASQPKILDGYIISRAREFGIGPSIRQLTHKDRFGSLGRFYVALAGGNGYNLYPARRVGLFDEWATDNFINYLQRIGAGLGRRPYESDVLKLAKDDVRNPSPKIIASRCGGSFNQAVELAGYVVVQNWEPIDFIEWGKKFRIANPEVVLNVNAIDYLSRQQKGPSRAAIARNFGKMRIFYSKVEQILNEELEKRENDRQLKLSMIQEHTREGRLPAELLTGVSSEEAMIVRYAKYLVLDDLLTDKHRSAKLSIATESCQTVVENGFIGSIRKKNDAITAGDVESTALYLGVFDDIWPDRSYMTVLKIPDDYRLGAKLVAQEREPLLV